jgi:pilus assembly protein FimV
MPFTRRCLPFVITGMATALVLDASAAGLSASGTSAVLGQPLDFAVQVRLQPGESLAQECVSAEVTVGDRRVPPSMVRAVLVATGTDSARVRVMTDQAIDEPVVGVLLNAGCASARYTRRFVVLADPPIDVAPSVVAAAAMAAPLVPAQAFAPVAAPSGATRTAPLDAAAVGAAAGGVAVAAPSSPRQPMPRAARVPETPEARQAREARRAAQRLARAERRAAAVRSAAPRTDAPAAEMAAPRLRLEAVEPAANAAAVGVEAALQAVAEASSAAPSRPALASPRSSGTRLARAEQASRWTTPLLALVLLLTALAAWLAWRLNGAERARQRGWQTPLPAANAAPNSELTPSKLPTSPIPFVNSEVRLPPPAAARPRPAWPAPVSLAPDTEPPSAMLATQPLERPERENPMLRTEPMPSRGVNEETAPRDVSIEELIDLEQQAEFFVVLGQDDAAVDLLVEHLRHTGGGSPLPYLKLLEIYRRRGRRAEYERLRERFNLRFNAYAPEWEADLQAGRTLDTYAGVIPRLQQVWPRPLDAMAELEALLFRKSRGDLFELPAYREVLFLYSLARDLLDREAADSGQIDLLLPLADGGEFSSTSPAPYLALERDSTSGGLDGKATSPVDFDLSSDPGRPTSIFGPLDDTPARPSRR